MMKCLIALKDAAAKFGGTVDMSTLSSNFVTVDAAPGKVWQCNGSSCISVDASTYTWTGAVKYALDDIKDGVYEDEEYMVE